MGVNCGRVSLCLHGGKPTTGVDRSNFIICLGIRLTRLIKLDIYPKMPQEVENEATLIIIIAI